MRQSNDGMLGAMPVPRLVVTMSLPIMLSMLISAVYNLVDSVYVAQYSDEAFLALSYAYPIQMLLVAFCSGIGVGFSAIFSRRLGEGDQEQAASAVCHGFFLYGLCWLLFLLFALTGAAPFLRLSTEDPSVARQGAQYLLICCGLSIGTCMQFLTERILQAMGRPAGFMIVQGSGAILNLILDPIFIFVLDLGVAGAAARHGHRPDLRRVDRLLAGVPPPAPAPHPPAGLPPPGGKCWLRWAASPPPPW